MSKPFIPAQLALFVTAFSLVIAAHSVRADTWPSKPIHVLVSFGPGGLTDQIARVIQPSLQAGFGQPIIIDNKPGAGGTLAEGALAKSAPDGYTLLLSSDSVPANQHLMKRLSYDSAKDLLPVSEVAQNSLVMLVSNNVPASTLKEFVLFEKTANAKHNYGSPGVGTSNHLFFEVFKDLTGLDMAHIPYKGGAHAITDLMGGQIDALMISSTLAVPQVTGGKVKALAVTGDRRLASLPNVPTFAESGYPDFKPQQWTGLFVPAGTPTSIVGRIHFEFSKALMSPDVVARLKELNSEPVMSSPAEFAAFLRSESQTLGRLIKDRGITAD